MLILNILLLCTLLGGFQQEISADAEPTPSPKRLVEANYAVQLPNGELVVSCRPAPDCPAIPVSAQLVDPETGKVLAMFADNEVEMGLAKVDPKGAALAFIAHGDLHIWPLKAGLDGADEAVKKRRAELEVVLDLAPKHDWGAQDFLWTHDGRFLVTWPQQFFHATPTGKIQLWKRTGELMWTGPMVSQASVHPTQNRICAVAGGKVLMGWPLDEQGEPKVDGMRTVQLEVAMDTIAFSPDGHTIAVGGASALLPNYSSGQPRKKAWPLLWLLDAQSGEVKLSKKVEGVDNVIPGSSIYLSDVRWSPDGSMLGVSLGKGHRVGALSSKDGSVVWTGGLQGGRMNELFDTGWTDSGILLTGWGSTRLVDPRNPENPVKLERIARATLLNLAGTEDIVVLYGWKIARLNPTTGELRWTL
ncbi:MAG: WD40 repeat protein [Glaciecola sp.]|jgi:WD40 repeat protein